MNMSNLTRKSLWGLNPTRKIIAKNGNWEPIFPDRAHLLVVQSKWSVMRAYVQLRLHRLNRLHLGNICIHMTWLNLTKWNLGRKWFHWLAGYSPPSREVEAGTEVDWEGILLTDVLSGARSPCFLTQDHIPSDGPHHSGLAPPISINQLRECPQQTYEQPDLIEAIPNWEFLFQVSQCGSCL